MSNPIGSLGSNGGAGALGQAGGTSATTGTAQTGSSPQGLAGTDTFLKLLVAQLRNQDPTSPMDDQAFVTELAQFNTVEQMINLKDQVAAQVAAQQATEGIALLGKNVTFNVKSLTGDQTTSSQGQVSGVSMVGGAIQLNIGAQQVSLKDVTAVGGQASAQAVAP